MWGVCSPGAAASRLLGTISCPLFSPRPCLHTTHADVEFRPELNPGKDGEAAVDALLEIVGRRLWDAFQIRLDAARSVLELDSSTPDKFSRHVIVRLPGAAFASNAHAGGFVRELCAAARQDAGAGYVLVVASAHPHYQARH